MVPWVGLQCLFVVFPGHTCFLMENNWCHKTSIFGDRYADANGVGPGHIALLSVGDTFPHC